MANQHQLTPMQKQFASDCEPKRKSMFLYVARELTGRYRQRHLPKGKQLDWEKFNKVFNKFYADYSADEMLEEILVNCYWLSSEQAVIDLYFRYLEDAVKNSKNSKANDDDNDDFTK